MDHISYEDETTQYVGACPVNKVIYVFSHMATHHWEKSGASFF